MKYFIITVDTEGDNLWAWKKGQEITTRNADYIEKFQSLCESYGFPPVYLINYEMIMNEKFSTYIGNKAVDRKCEIGLHIHAWNSPPYFDLIETYGGNSFITEYPPEIQKEKISLLKSLIRERTGIDPVSFRSGRWATDMTLFQQLEQLGFLVDCSITPGISNYSDKGMSVAHGNDYTDEMMDVHSLLGNLIEIPMTTARIRTYRGATIKNRMRNILLGKDIWLRPAMNSAEEMIDLCKIADRRGLEYLEFMIHSSELMPGGSPYTKNEAAVEVLFERMEEVFKFVSASAYKGTTLAEYYQVLNGSI